MKTQQQELVKPCTAAELARLASPSMARSGWLRRFREANWENIQRGLSKIARAEEFGIPTMHGTLYARLLRRNGDILDYGLISTRVVTTAGAGFVVDAFQGSVELEIMKYHGIGTNNTAENVADTTLNTELTTQYIVNSTRATGTLGEGASANIFRTVGTNEVDASVTIVEHGIFSNATVASGVLFDRSIFAGIGMVSGDQLQTTYDWTMATGG